MTDTWKHGQKRELAARCSLSPQFITDLTKRTRRASPGVALELEKASEEMGLPIDREDWANPQWSDSPFFDGEPEK